MNSIQSNTQEGLVVKTSAVDLDGLEGYLARIDSSGEADLPASTGDLVQFVIEDTNAGVGEDVTLRPLEPNRNVRVKSAAIIAAGGEATASSTGAALAASSGNWVFAIAESAVASGDLGLFRPVTYKKA